MTGMPYGASTYAFTAHSALRAVVHAVPDIELVELDPADVERQAA